MSSSDVASITLDALRSRITGVFPAQIRSAIEPLTDEQIWWRPNESSNSIGNLMLHLAGSVQLYLNKLHGGVEFTRDREAEFTERTHIAKGELLARFDDVFETAVRTFEKLTPEHLTTPSPVPSMHQFAVQDLINIAAHISTHAGQIVWIAKALTGRSLDDVWMTSHREHGGWKKA
ncbi:MAG TPA: DUF1572 family protein [Thermoanaerobaculia bacterium]|jgi:uncharacterized damage-inducible protein DinB